MSKPCDCFVGCYNDEDKQSVDAGSHVKSPHLLLVDFPDVEDGVCSRGSLHKLLVYVDHFSSQQADVLQPSKQGPGSTTVLVHLRAVC